MVAFLCITVVEGWEGMSRLYPLIYTFKVLLVTAALYQGRKVWKDIRFDPKMLVAGLLFGFIGYIAWVYIDRYTPHIKLLGSRSGYNPYHEISNDIGRDLFLAIRFYGLAVMVPVMEELFWRSFLLRWITDEDFTKLKIGEYSWKAFAIVAGLFALAHPEWLAAAIYAVGIGLMLRKTGSIFACVTAHATTNLLLGIYVLHTHSWVLW